MKLFPTEVLVKIRELTEGNDHTGAVLLAAETMKHKKLVAALTGVKAIHEFTGHISTELVTIRYYLSKKLWHYAELNYSNYQAIYDAF